MPNIANTTYPKSGLQISHTQQKITMINGRNRIAKETERGRVDFNKNSVVHLGNTSKDSSPFFSFEEVSSSISLINTNKKKAEKKKATAESYKQY